MTNFFNAFLLNLLLFSQKHHFDARTVNPETLDKNPLEIEDSLLNEIESRPPLRRRNEKLERIFEESQQADFGNKEQVPFEPYYLYEPPNYLLNGPPQIYEKDEYNSEKSDFLKNPMRSWRDDMYTNCMKDVVKKWKSLIARNRRKRVLRYLSKMVPDDTAEYLDYTNSQMPFNEGRARHKTFREKHPEILDDNLGTGRGVSDMMNFPPFESEPIRRRSSLKKRFETPLRSQEKNFDVLGDDPILKYSRVRRFLDHERAKKRKRMSSTLEAKEAAMSRVLDPNVNLEGILEPHVRKRRGVTEKERQLQLRIQRLNSKRWKSKHPINHHIKKKNNYKPLRVLIKYTVHSFLLLILCVGYC